MNQSPVVMGCVGVALLAVGFAMTLNEKVALWGVTHGRGRIWSRLLGQDNAVKVTRLVFGPFTVFLGMACLAGLL